MFAIAANPCFAFDDLGTAFGKAREMVRNFRTSSRESSDRNNSGRDSSGRDTEENRQERERERAREAARRAARAAERQRREAERRARREAAERERQRIENNFASLNNSLSAAGNIPKSIPPETDIPRTATEVAATQRELNTLLSTAPQMFHVEVEPSGLSGVVSPGQAADAAAQAAWRLQMARAAQIRDAIISGASLSIEVKPSPAHAYQNPWYQRPDKEMVTRSDGWIVEESRKAGIDPDFVRAIVWMESTHGWYDAFVPESERKTILPMNVYVSYWSGLGIKREDMSKTDANIHAGVTILKGLWGRVNSPSIEKVATLYHDLRDDAVSGYGKTVDYYYRTKPWKQVRR